MLLDLLLVCLVVVLVLSYAPFSNVTHKLVSWFPSNLQVLVMIFFPFVIYALIIFTVCNLYARIILIFYSIILYTSPPPPPPHPTPEGLSKYWDAKCLCKCNSATADDSNCYFWCRVGRSPSNTKAACLLCLFCFACGGCYSRLLFICFVDCGGFELFCLSTTLHLNVFFLIYMIKSCFAFSFCN